MRRPNPPRIIVAGTPETGADRRQRGRKVGDDDLDLDLPDEDGPTADTEASDDAWDPEDDSDLGLEDSSEDVGLDTATGLDDDKDDLDLDDSGEGVSWTADSEDADDLPGADADLLHGEEYGWLGEDEPAPEEDDELDSELEDEVVATSDDGGAEGLDDDGELDELDMTNLPAIDADAEEGADPLSADAFDDLAEVALPDEPLLEVADGVTWKRVLDRSLRITELNLPSDAGPICSVVALDDTTLVLGSEVALYVSNDGGLQFERNDAACGAAGVAITRSETGTLCWASDAHGKLCVSRDGAATFRNVAQSEKPTWISAEGARLSMLVAEQPSGPARILQTSDGGTRFSSTVLPEHGGLQPTLFATSRSVLLLADEDRVLCATRGKAMRALVEGARAPALLLDEDDEPFAYACVSQAQRVLVVRVSVQGSGVPRAPLVVAALDRAAYGELRALTASYAEGLVTLHAVTERSLLRIEASLDGEALAPA